MAAASKGLAGRRADVAGHPLVKRLEIALPRSNSSCVDRAKNPIDTNLDDVSAEMSLTYSVLGTGQSGLNSVLAAEGPYASSPTGKR